MLKKFLFSSIILIIGLTGIAGNASAASYQFFKGYDGSAYVNSYLAERNNTYTTNGNYFRLKVTDMASNNCMKVQLWERDTTNADDRIGSEKSVCGGGTATWNISNYKDGDNGKAELYLVYGHSTRTDSYIFLNGYRAY